MLSPTRRATDSFDRSVGTPSRVQVRRDVILEMAFAVSDATYFFLLFVSRASRGRGGVGDGHVGWGVAIGGDDDWCAARVLGLG